LTIYSNFSQIAVSPADTTAVVSTLAQQTLILLSLAPAATTTTTIEFNSSFKVTFGSNPCGLLYINEYQVLVVHTTGGFYLYNILSTGLVYNIQIY
jgi:hypothetical protein